jgi:hypothetical protein
VPLQQAPVGVQLKTGEAELRGAGSAGAPKSVALLCTSVQPLFARKIASVALPAPGVPPLPS